MDMSSKSSKHPAVGMIAEHEVANLLTQIAQYAHWDMNPEQIAASAIAFTSAAEMRELGSMLVSVATAITELTEGEGAGGVSLSSAVSPDSPPPSAENFRVLSKMVNHDPELAGILGAHVTIVQSELPLVILGNVGYEVEIGGES